MKTRHCARALVVNEHREVLLLLYEDEQSIDPVRPELKRYWVTPGGGVEDGETHEAAIRRELDEETGIQNPHIGPCIWSRTRTLMHQGELKTHIERYYLVQVAKADCPMINRTTDEAIQQQRWWSHREIRLSDDNFLPSEFTALIEPILDGCIPEAPRQIENQP